MFQDDFIIGATGNVGLTTVRQIFNEGDTDPKRHENPTRIVGLASSTHFLYDPNGIKREVAFAFAERKRKGKTYKGLDTFLDIADSASSPIEFVDITALGTLMTRFHLSVIGTTNHGIVTANKVPLTEVDFSTFQFLTRNVRRYGYRCSVMAGAEAVDFIQDARDLGDKITGIEGCFSGTLGYVVTRLHQGASFFQAVAEAREKGYTEPNPIEDLSGKDVGRKLLTLGRTVGLDHAYSDINVVPLALQKDLKKNDKDFAERVRKAERKENVLRYVASLKFKDEKPILEASLREVPKDSPLGALNGTNNKIMITTDIYDSLKPYIVEAPGAGLDVTARNVRRDLLKHLKQRVVRNY